MTTQAPGRSVTPYRSQAGPGKDGFAQLLRAEFIKLRTVRGWVVFLVIAPLLMVGFGKLLSQSGCTVTAANGRTVACPVAPTGPTGQGVVDSYYFAHQTLTGNGTITARITSLTGKYATANSDGTAVSAARPGVQPWSKAGLMITVSTRQGSSYAAIMATGGNGVRMQSNYTADVAGLPGQVSAASPRWLRLTRSGGTVTGYDSPDGTHWTKVHSVVLSGLGASAPVGLFTTSPSYTGNSATFSFGPSVATGTFDHVELAWPGAPRSAGASWTGTSIGAMPYGPNGPNPFTGSFTQSGGTVTVTGTGDIAPQVPDQAYNGLGTKPEYGLYGSIAALIVLVIVAALFMTSEYRRKLIRVTFTASPRRGRVLLAKATVIGLVTFLVSLVGGALALNLFLSSSGTNALATPSITEVRMVVGAAVLLGLAAVLALALGALARRGVFAVTAVIVVILLPFLLATAGPLPLGVEDWLVRVTPTAGFAVIQSLPAYHQVSGTYTPEFGYFPLSWWAGLLVTFTWAAAGLALAGSQLRRRDA
jgi:ABC-type transport system involved in multi-copper enzyme maturation permease subunit